LWRGPLFNSQQKLPGRDDPLISGNWLGFESAGGIDIFADRRNRGAAKDRIVRGEEVVAREPDVIMARGAARNSGLSAL
jgi:hypothetical protein